MMKQAMKMGINRSGGDDYFNRLLSYFKQQFKEPIIKMEQIRDSVYIVKTKTNKYVVKGYSRNKKLKLQETFTTSLNQEGFEKTYRFFTDLTLEPLFFEGEYFGCMEYLDPHPKDFTFHSHKNRKEGLKLLEEFHQVTASCVTRYKTLLSYSDLPVKWSERLRSFKKFVPQIGHYISDQTINEILGWAEWSLNGMRENKDYFYNEPYVILHGDVAHHNFLRDTSGNLNLIDFDLIHIGPASVDLIQYANRILPSIDWSLDGLSKYRQIGAHLKEKAFLYGLAFPTDILREWNRIIKEKKYTKYYYTDYVIGLTMDQLHLRRKFVDSIKKSLGET